MPFDFDAIMSMGSAAKHTSAGSAQDPEKQIVMLQVDRLEDFPPELHKFRPATGQRLADLEESIRQNGILNAIHVRQLPGSRYQIIAGHNRRTAARNIGYRAVPCIVRNLPNDDDAIRAMIADNMNSRELLPSELGWAYQQELKIRKKQGQRSDLTSSQFGRKLETAEIMGGEKGVSKNKIHRYIRLMWLISPLLELVDQQKMGLGTAEQLSYLSNRSQEVVYQFCYAATPQRPLKEAHAKALREAEADPDRIVDEDLLEELTVKKPSVRLRTLKIEMSSLREYFPAGTPEEVVVQTIQTALGVYFDRKDIP